MQFEGRQFLSVRELQQSCVRPRKRDATCVPSHPIRAQCAKSQWTAAAKAESRHTKRFLQWPPLTASLFQASNWSPSLAMRNTAPVANAPPSIRRRYRLRRKRKRQPRSQIPQLPKDDGACVVDSINELLPAKRRRASSATKSRRTLDSKLGIPASKYVLPAFNKRAEYSPKPIGRGQISACPQCFCGVFPTNPMAEAQALNADKVSNSTSFRESASRDVNDSVLPAVQRISESAVMNCHPADAAQHRRSFRGHGSLPESLLDGTTSQLCYSGQCVLTSSAHKSSQTVPEGTDNTSREHGLAGAVGSEVSEPSEFGRPPRTSIRRTYSDTWIVTPQVRASASSFPETSNETVIDVLSCEADGLRTVARTRCFALCLGAAALLSFWVCYTVADMAVGSRIFGLGIRDEGPGTVKLEEESEFTLSGTRRTYVYGPYFKELNISSEHDPLSLSETTFIRNASIETATSA